MALLISVSWLTHLLRDAHRRGLWFPPLGSTPALPAAVYIGATLALCLLVRWAAGPAQPAVRTLDLTGQEIPLVDVVTR